MNVLIILPNQLYRLDYVVENIVPDSILLWEHPHYFTKYNYNKKKLLLHRASMKCYQDYLVENHYTVEYVEYHTPHIKQKKKYTYCMFDPIDNIEFTCRIDDILPSPNFIMSLNDYAEYRKKTDKFMFNNFYMWAKKRLDILPGIKSQDKYNRGTMPKDVHIPSLPSNQMDTIYIKEASIYIETHFGDNYGNTDNFIFPISFSSAKEWLDDFVENRLEMFGPYQDYIFHKEPYLYHSCLSSSINIGLLQPSEIISIILLRQNDFSLNSVEGYIRQLFWREYQRYCYIYCTFPSHFFKIKQSLGIQWYNGTTGIDPIDDYIKIAFNTGYLHHIVRLMLIGNYMNLIGIDPADGFRWFMEFSIDSYEWVMTQNVLDMVFFVTGGVTMRRPYASSSNYIIKMSTYKKGIWSDTWDEMYKQFMITNKDLLWKFRYYFPALKKL